MITKKKAFQITHNYENLVFININDIGQLIQMHAQLGQYEMEIFVLKKKAEKFASALRKKGFYCRIITFRALEHECRLYVSWIS